MYDTTVYKDFPEIFVKDDSLFFHLVDVRYSGCPEGNYKSEVNSDTLIIKVNAVDYCEMLTYETNVFYGLFLNSNYKAVKVIDVKAVNSTNNIYILDNFSQTGSMSSVISGFEEIHYFVKDTTDTLQ